MQLSVSIGCTKVYQRDPVYFFISCDRHEKCKPCQEMLHAIVTGYVLKQMSYTILISGDGYPDARMHFMCQHKFSQPYWPPS